jgi:hypothetical protein
MKPMMNALRSIPKTLVAGTTLVMASAAVAQVYVQPQPPRPRYEVAAPARTLSLAVPVGWQGDHYWDGHRYWGHDEWMQHHPNERDQQSDQALAHRE